MRRFFILLGTIIIVGPGQAQQRTEVELQQIAAERLGMTTRSAASTVRELQRNDQIAVWGNDGGFVVMACNKKYDAVKGYSYTMFDADNLPCGLKWWMEATTRALSDGSARKVSERTRASYSAVEPFITTAWDQGKPYNYKCPKEKLTSADRCLTGCVATAMAQAMRYYKYPASPNKTQATYYVGEKKKTATISASTVYDWAHMKDGYSEYDLQLSPAVEAVGTLMRDAGYASGMHYTTDGSGTNDFLMTLAMAQTFNYDSLALRRYDRQFYLDDEWQQIIYSALAKRQPVLFGGSTKDDDGHEFLLCGLDSEGKVYVNWGWSGDGNGYYDMDAPRYHSYSFSEYQSAVVGMKAQETSDKQDSYESIWISDSINYIVPDEPDTLYLQTTILYNYSLLDFNGSVDVTLVNKKNPALVHYLNLFCTEEKEIGTIGAFYGFYFIEEDEDADTYQVDTIAVGGLRNVPAGIYRMYLTSNEVRDTERQIVRVPGGTQYATLKKLEDGRILVSNDDVADIDPTGIVNEKTTMRNERLADGKVYGLSGQRMDGLKRHGIRIERGRKIIYK